MQMSKLFALICLLSSVSNVLSVEHQETKAASHPSTQETDLNTLQKPVSNGNAEYSHATSDRSTNDTSVNIMQNIKFPLLIAATMVIGIFIKYLFTHQK